jgi:dolichol-phosphate mannosyltransferase
LDKTNQSPGAHDDSRGVYILLPLLNERENIAELLDGIEQSLEGRSYTIGIIDDGSTDGTVEYLQERMRRAGHHIHLTQRRKTTRGSQRGGALHDLLLWGLAHTDHEVFVEMDGDLSHRPEELPVGLRCLAAGDCDIAVASKYVPGSDVTRRPLGRRLVSRTCSAAVRLLISFRLRDYSNGYRFYTRRAAQFVAAHKIRYSNPIYLTEVMALWLRNRMPVAEFRTTYVGRNEGLSKLRVTDLVKAAVFVFEIAWRYHLTGFAQALPQNLDPVPHVAAGRGSGVSRRHSA